MSKNRNYLWHTKFCFLCFFENCKMYKKKECYKQFPRVFKICQKSWGVHFRGRGCAHSRGDPLGGLGVGRGWVYDLRYIMQNISKSGIWGSKNRLLGGPKNITFSSIFFNDFLDPQMRSPILFKTGVQKHAKKWQKSVAKSRKKRY